MILKIDHADADSTGRISRHLYQMLSPLPQQQEIVVVCVGTDRSTGDALGPLVGTRLNQHNHMQRAFSLYGTLDQPVHAMNLKETMALIEQKHRNPFIIGIDACLGQFTSVGHIQIGDGPVKPGAGVHKDLPPVGHMHVTGIVNVGGFMEYFVLQNTRLSLVVKMAETIADSLYMSIQHVRATATSFAAPE